jgi:hypothetical protein
MKSTEPEDCPNPTLLAVAKTGIFGPCDGLWGSAVSDPIPIVDLTVRIAFMPVGWIVAVVALPVYLVVLCIACSIRNKHRAGVAAEYQNFNRQTAPANYAGAPQRSYV